VTAGDEEYQTASLKRGYWTEWAHSTKPLDENIKAIELVCVRKYLWQNLHRP